MQSIYPVGEKILISMLRHLPSIPPQDPALTNSLTHTLDARYEKVRHGGQVIDCAVLVAVGISPTGHRSILGCSVSLSEAEVHGA